MVRTNSKIVPLYIIYLSCNENKVTQSEPTVSILHQPAPTTLLKETPEQRRVHYRSADDVRHGPPPTAQPQRLLPGYTVSKVPAEWNWPRNRYNTSLAADICTRQHFVEIHELSRLPTPLWDREQLTVHTVSITWRDKPLIPGAIGSRYGGRVTIEEVLDAIFQETKPIDSLDSGIHSRYANTFSKKESTTPILYYSLPQVSGAVTPVGYEGPSIYTKVPTVHTYSIGKLQ